ncbi:thiolase family protein [Caenimonas soli]|uniref:thiolase family protein n=1 Tax=Caenimonas soli TaxID=2735555 RepID=UPI0015529402|nr:acetyl-CoA C-acyltransferase [Caenimonas soli]NPC59155.1 acetyl-CoA C-acyltransferase [Caenimonas soli]
MQRFGQDVYLASGLRTPFGRGGGALSSYDSISLSVPIARAMAEQLRGGRPDMVLWGAVMPNLGWSNIAREIWLDAGLDPTVPSFSVVLACATSITAAFAAAGMIGGGTDAIMVGGAEMMSKPSIGLKPPTSERLRGLLAKDPEAAAGALAQLSPKDFILPTKGWANRITGRTMGDHMEETARGWGITRQAQDEWAYKSHMRAAAGWERGFFSDLVLPLPELAKDSNLRPDTSLQKLGSLAPAFDRTSGRGTVTAGNSSPITDGAAGVWVLSERGLERLHRNIPAVKLVDFEISALDPRDGLLMAPSFAIPRLLDRQGLRYGDIALWEIHEAFAAQVLSNVAALVEPNWIEDRIGIATDFGPFPWDRVNPNGGSLALGHPFGATGARDLSQAVKELAAMPKGSRAIVSVCADGGEGAVALLESAY